MVYVNNMGLDILIIEDNPHDAELTTMALGKIGLSPRLRVFEDGVEALDFLYGTGPYTQQKHQCFPKLILLDLKLPKMSGLEVLGHLKGDDRTKMVPVVVLTSSEQDSDIESSYALGANSYVVKPVDFDEFSRTVSEVGSYWLSINHPPYCPSRFMA